MSEILYRQGAPLDAAQSRYPGFRPGTVRLEAGTVVKPGAPPLALDLEVEHDIAVRMRDGIAIYADVYRPAGHDGPLPAIVAWSAYGKSGGYMTFDDYPFRAGVPQRLLSGLDKFEGPDPAWWCARGYAVVNPDARGAFRSEGKLRVWDRQEGEDGHDLIEWIAEQPWSSGKVGTAGTSWLCTAQWFIGAERPPHLAAMAAWEGLCDSWRHTFFDGGIPDATFVEWLMRDAVSMNGIEDVPAMLEQHPEFDDYWAGKRAAVEKIDVPVYAKMSWGSKLHSPSFFDAWHRLTTEHKWLRLEPDLEWPDFYENRNRHDLLRFFDRFLKGLDNGWEATPPVRMSVVDFAGSEILDRAESSFPVGYARPATLHLAPGGVMATDAPDAATLVHDAKTGTASFDFAFTAPNEINGYPELHLFVEARGSDDADLFVKLVKLGPDGEQQLRVLLPLDDPEYEERRDEVEATCTGAMRALYAYDGSWARMRASRRAIPSDPRVAPVYPPEELLKTGDVVELHFTMPPVALAVRAGETLRLMVAGHDLSPLELPGMRALALRNRGEHAIHVGDERPSRLVLPLVSPVD